MSGWIPIDAEPQPLTPTQQRIKELLDAGKNVHEIVWAVHMGKDFVIEEIYQIRKWESIMGKKPKFDKNERAELLRLHNEERYSVGKLATKYGCSQTAVKTALNAAKIEAEDEPVQKRTQINPEFDAAVNEMIAESKSADAEENSAIAEERHSDADSDIEKDTLDTKSDTIEPLPDAVYRALLANLNDIQFDIEEREQRIAELTDEIRQLKHDRDEIIDWKDKYEH